MITVSHKKPHLDDNLVASGDEEAGQSNKWAGSDDQSAELHEEEPRPGNAGEELYEAEEEVDQEVEAEDLELEQEASLEEDNQTAHSSMSVYFLLTPLITCLLTDKEFQTLT